MTLMFVKVTQIEFDPNNTRFVWNARYELSSGETAEKEGGHTTYSSSSTAASLHDDILDQMQAFLLADRSISLNLLLGDRRMIYGLQFSGLTA